MRITIICNDCKQSYSYEKPQIMKYKRQYCAPCAFKRNNNNEMYKLRASVHKCLVCGYMMSKRTPQVHVVGCLDTFKTWDKRVSKEEFKSLQGGGWCEEGQGLLI
jgi:hypothetical protein